MEDENAKLIDCSMKLNEPEVKTARRKKTKVFHCIQSVTLES